MNAARSSIIIPKLLLPPALELHDPRNIGTDADERVVGAIEEHHDRCQVGAIEVFFRGEKSPAVTIVKNSTNTRRPAT